LPTSLQVFDQQQRTVVFNSLKNEERENLTYYKIEKEPSLVQALMAACYQLNLPSVLIEGGNKLAESFINENMWDEARVIENTGLIIDNGLRAPLLSNHLLVASETLATDVISCYLNKSVEA